MVKTGRSNTSVGTTTARSNGRMTVPYRRRSQISLPPPEVEHPSPEEDQPQGTSPKGIQGPVGPSPNPDWDYNWPCTSTNPKRPRITQARYSKRLSTLEVVFRNGIPWHFDCVPPEVWGDFKRVVSPGRYLDRVLKGFPNGAGSWGSIVGQ
jgi:hypothetical protein